MTGGLRQQATRVLSALDSPARVVAVVLIVHVAWVAAFFATGHEIRDFIRIGPQFVSQSTESDVIRVDPTYDYPRNFDSGRPGEGYDGQFAYFLALDPKKARYYMDVPTYRYERPLYPMVARALGFGDPDLIPWSLLVVNLAAMAVVTLALALWLRRRNLAAWWALAFSLAPGLLVSTQRDLTEPLGYALLACALLAADALPRRTRWLAAGVLLGLAGLARQTTLVFAPFLILGEVLRGDGDLRSRVKAGLPRAAGMAALAAGPYFAWSTYIQATIDDPVGASDQFTLVPFGGFFETAFELERTGVSLLTVGLPAAVLLVVAVRLLRERAGLWAPAALAVSALVFVVFNIDSNAYPARGRAAIGVAFAAVVCLPWLLRRNGRERRWLQIAAALWFSMLPVVAVYGLSLSSA